METDSSSLVLVGAGRMGSAMLRGWIAAGLDPSRTTVIEPIPSEALAAFCDGRGIALNAEAPATPATLVLAIKPQGFEAAAPALVPLVGPETLVVSILAGKTVSDIRARLPAGSVVRAMPNLPASIGSGATGAFASPAVTPAQRKTADRLLACVGLVEWLEQEALIDAVTALSGSGPAYVFLLAEAMTRAGTAAGLPEDVAARLARATVAGAGRLLAEPEADPARLRRDVTSPGGTTAAALAVLTETEGLPDLVARAMAAAAHRAAELSG